MKNIHMLFAAVALFSVFALPVYSAEETPKKTEELKKVVLSSDLTILVKEISQVPVQLWYNVGSKDEHESRDLKPWSLQDEIHKIVTSQISMQSKVEQFKWIRDNQPSLTRLERNHINSVIACWSELQSKEERKSQKDDKDE